jgi:hypothetical protein
LACTIHAPSCSNVLFILVNRVCNLTLASHPASAVSMPTASFENEFWDITTWGVPGSGAGQSPPS